jgi:hypothetical protein
MSAIGTCVILRRQGYAECLERASEIRTETSGRWVFKKSFVSGLAEFRQAWEKHVVEEKLFGFSGYVIGWYLDAQEEINGRNLYDQQTDAVKLLSRAFTSAFPFEHRVKFPELPQDDLLRFVNNEFGPTDAEGMIEALQGAHRFYLEGMEKIDEQNVGIFIIN